MRRLSESQNIIIGELCNKLHCSELAHDLEKVNHARELFAQLQQKKFLTEKVKTFSSFFDEAQTNLITIADISTSESTIQTIEESVLTEEEDEFKCPEFSHDRWLGYFRGYKILEEDEQCTLNENKQCIELTLEDDNISIQRYLRAGIRCFMIDLFLGTETNKQHLILKLKESELKVSQEYGFPIATTLCALLSPRLQFTGVMDPRYPTDELRKGVKTILTTHLKYTTICNCYKIYVNAKFLIQDCTVGDIILVGPKIQLAVTEVLNDDLKCVVIEPGILRSRLPVLFPDHCRRTDISLEELEDITFAREVGINVLVSYKPGSKEYLNGLYDALRLLNCDHLRIFTRLVLNEYGDEKCDELDWITNSYDGFLVDISTRQNIKCIDLEDDNDTNLPKILNLSSAAVNFMEKTYNMQKPIILKPSLIGERKMYVQQWNIPHIFYYPDKFMFSKDTQKNGFYFFLLQNALTKDLPVAELSKQYFCDPSDLGDDSIARACVGASLQSQVKAIIVCSAWSDASIKLSHFRPIVPIIHVSATKSLSDYISLYHHITFMNFQAPTAYSYNEYVTNAFIFSLIYLETRNIICTGDNILLVYGSEMVTKLCDRYLVYKHNDTYFHENLTDILFA